MSKKCWEESSHFYPWSDRERILCYYIPADVVGKQIPVDFLSLAIVLMRQIQYRQALTQDIPAMARLLAQRRGEVDFWVGRMSAYLRGDHHPQHALASRICYVAEQQGVLVGLIAGHLTTRFGCKGELQWVHVDSLHRRNSVASALLNLLVQWFLDHGAFTVCVNVEPENAEARAFYLHRGASELNAYWYAWNDIRRAQDPHAGPG
jgi:GNAT superfamily N-acetyltransferase